MLKALVTSILIVGLTFAVTQSALAKHHEAGEATADQPLSLEALAVAFGWDLQGAQITAEKIDDGLYVLFGVGGNIGVSIGEDGVLIVDDQFPQVMEKIEAAIDSIGGNGIDYAINTHWHFDHAEGNNTLGPQGTTIVAHSNARADMAKGGLVNLVIAKYRQQAYPKAALPVLTFDDRMQIHFNDNQIDLMHFSPAHTDGDAAVWFRQQNAVHLGDVFNNSGYPFVDVDSGGGIDGMIHFCQQVLDAVGPDAIIIPGHGPVTDTAALARYIYMLTTVRSRVADMIDQGMTLQQVVDAKPTANFDEVYGPETASLGFVNRVYTSLALQ
ncbi:MAG: MBL fold metallo-hydrolase [Pseudomonadales bacterium]|nr:MBL fold metallo-hydrolase [Pseudomonadales bacterium]